MAVTPPSAPQSASFTVCASATLADASTRIAASAWRPTKECAFISLPPTPASCSTRSNEQGAPQRWRPLALHPLCHRHPIPQSGFMAVRQEPDAPALDLATRPRELPVETSKTPGHDEDLHSALRTLLVRGIVHRDHFQGASRPLGERHIVHLPVESLAGFLRGEPYDRGLCEIDAVVVREPGVLQMDEGHGCRPAVRTRAIRGTQVASGCTGTRDRLRLNGLPFDATDRN